MTYVINRVRIYILLKRLKYDVGIYYFAKIDEIFPKIFLIFSKYFEKKNDNTN